MHRPAFFFVVFVAFAPTLVPAQRHVSLAGSKLCDTCAISLKPEVILSTRDSVAPIGGTSPVARSNAGLYAVVSASAVRILLFDSTGKFLRAVGSTGTGPAEFSRITILEFGPGDSLFVFERNRFHVFTPEFRHVRTVPLPGEPKGAILRPDGRIIAAIDAGAALPVQVLKVDGTIEQAFGGHDRPSTGCATCIRLIGPAGPDAFFVFPLNQYVWLEWELTGRATSYEVRDSPWFRGWTDPGNWPARRAPRPTTLTSVFRVGNSQIWTQSISAPPQWKPGILRFDSSSVFISDGTLRAVSREAFDAFQLARDTADFVSTFEQFDLKNGSLLATLRVAGSVGLIGWPFAARRRLTATGSVVVDVFRIEPTHKD